jgi:hypothetical protein
VQIPLRVFQDMGSDLRYVDAPFMLYTEGTARLDLGRAGWRLGAERDGPGGALPQAPRVVVQAMSS